MLLTEFFKLNYWLNTVSVLNSDYQTVCVNLDFDNNNSMFEKVRLQSWQVTELDWLMKCKYSKLIDEIFENEMSLDKIFQVLLLIISAEKVTVIFYKSILILISFTLINIWIHKIHTHFSEVLHLFLYYDTIDSDKSTDFVWKRYIINFKNMKSFLVKLTSDNSEMSVTVILNVYSMWYKHTYHDSHDFLDSSWERDINQAEDNDDIDVETNKKWITSWSQKHSFRCVIMNKDHAIKNECTWIHKFIAALKILNH